MGKGLLKFVLGLGAAMVTVQPAIADLATWNITPGGTTFNLGQYANWTPYGGTNQNNANAATNGKINGIDYSIWDGFGPHGNANTATNFHDVQEFGGQNFDAKAMYLRNDNTNLYVGIVTGLNPASFVESGVTYKLGDLAINPDFANKTSQFGVISLTSPAGTSGNTNLVAGGIWNVPNVAEGWDTPLTNVQSGSTLVSSAVHYSYTDLGIKYQDATTGTMVESYLLEYSVALSSLGAKNGQSYSVSWGPDCSNDIISVTHTVAVPEPASMSLLGGLGMIALARRRRTNRA